MDIRQILEELQEVKRTDEEFLKRRKGEIVGMLAEDNVTAEESLQQEILMELIDKMNRVSQLIQYLGTVRVWTGTLSRDKKGNILFNGEIMPPLTEFEVCLQDNYREKVVWTRTFVSLAGAGEEPYLVGLGRKLKIDGIRARIRK